MGWFPTKGKITCLFTQSCPTLVTPWITAHQAPLPMGFFMQEYWSGLPFPLSGSFLPRDQTRVSCVSCIAGRFFTHWAIEEARKVKLGVYQKRWHFRPEDGMKHSIAIEGIITVVIIIIMIVLLTLLSCVRTSESRLSLEIWSILEVVMFK